MYWQAEEAKVVKDLPSAMNLSGLPEIRSLKSRKIIKNILDNGNKTYTRFGIFFLVKTDSEFINFAVLVKKSIGNAVKRNYCKRIVREYVRRNKAKFKEYNQIIFLYNSGQNVSFSDLKKEFDFKLNFS